MNTINICDSDSDIEFFPANPSISLRPRQDWSEEVIYCGMVKKSVVAEKNISLSDIRSAYALNSEAITVQAAGARKKSCDLVTNKPSLEINAVDITANKVNSDTYFKNVNSSGSVCSRSDSVNININSQNSVNTVTINIEDDDDSIQEVQSIPSIQPKPAEDWGDEIIFCGVSKSSSLCQKRNIDHSFNSVGFKESHSISKNVFNNSHVSKLPAARERSDSVNININSQESLNTNLTINIEDNADTSKKKVQLTFLGPSNRKRLDKLSSEVVERPPTFKPITTSTPVSYPKKNSYNLVSVKPANNKISDHIQTIIPSNVFSNFNLNKTVQKRMDRSFRDKTTKQPDVHSIAKPFDLNAKVISKKLCEIQNENIKTSSNKAIENERGLNEKIAGNSAIKKPDCKLGSKVVVDGKRYAAGSDEAVQTNSCSIKSGSQPNQAIKYDSKPGTSDIGRNKSPLPSTSVLAALSESSSTDSDDESSCSRNDDDSSSKSSNEMAISKSQLDALIYKFLDNCTKVSTKTEVLKMKVKLKRTYMNTNNATNNDDFIQVLKESIEKLDKKSLRCPLYIMKKVLAELRKNSPDIERKIMRLEKVLEEICQKIRSLEAAEVSSDEECENSYINLDRYRKRAVQIYNKICELSSTPADADRATRRNVCFQGTIPEAFSKLSSVKNLICTVSHALEKYHNKSRKFPDFNDVQILMKKLCIEGGYKMKPETLHQLAKNVFVEFGNMLQQRRLYDDYRICTEYLKDDDADDPYYYDPILSAKLDFNRKHRKNEQEILDKYCLKQVTMKDKWLSNDENNSQSSSQSESEQKRVKKKSKSSKRKIVSTVGDKTVNVTSFNRTNIYSSSSDESSKTDNGVRKEVKKIQYKIKKVKQNRSESSSDGEYTHSDRNSSARKDKSSNNKKRELSVDTDENTNKKLCKDNEKPVMPDLDHNSGSDVKFHSYENASTLIISDEVEKIKQTVAGNNEDTIDFKLTETDNNKDKIDCNSNVAAEIQGSLETRPNIDHDNVIDLVTSTLETDGKAELLEVTNPDNPFQNNSLGICITAVTTCDMSLTEEKGIQETDLTVQLCEHPCIELLSDDDNDPPL